MPHVNHEYVIWYIQGARWQYPSFRALDYGCGNGSVVEMGLAQGLDISGVDVFYVGSNDRQITNEKGLLGKYVFEIVDGKIPYPEVYFDFVISNQVFEHVPDLDAVLAEIHRVLKPDGHMLALLPHASQVWEVHMSLPLTHWFPKGSKVRFLWTFTWRCLGFGNHKGGKSRWAWTRHTLSWLDTFCFYRSRREIESAVRPLFDIINLEHEYVEFRKPKSWRWRFLAPFPKPLAFMNGIVFRTMAGLVFLAAKKSAENHRARGDMSQR